MVSVIKNEQYKRWAFVCEILVNRCCVLDGFFRAVVTDAACISDLKEVFKDQKSEADFCGILASCVNSRTHGRLSWGNYLKLDRDMIVFRLFDNARNVEIHHLLFQSGELFGWTFGFTGNGTTGGGSGNSGGHFQESASSVGGAASVQQQSQEISFPKRSPLEGNLHHAVLPATPPFLHPASLGSPKTLLPSCDQPASSPSGPASILSVTPSPERKPRNGPKNNGNLENVSRHRSPPFLSSAMSCGSVESEIRCICDGVRASPISDDGLESASCRDSPIFDPGTLLNRTAPSGPYSIADHRFECRPLQQLENASRGYHQITPSSSHQFPCPSLPRFTPSMFSSVYNFTPSVPPPAANAPRMGLWKGFDHDPPVIPPRHPPSTDPSRRRTEGGGSLSSCSSPFANNVSHFRPGNDELPKTSYVAKGAMCRSRSAGCTPSALHYGVLNR